MTSSIPVVLEKIESASTGKSWPLDPAEVHEDASNVGNSLPSRLNVGGSLDTTGEVIASPPALGPPPSKRKPIVPAPAGGDKERMVQLAREVIASREKELEGMNEKRQVLLLQFNTMRKALTIILDDELYKLAISGKSGLRRVANYYTHLWHELSDKVRDVLRHAKDLADESGVLSIDERNIDFKAEVERLVGILHESENYFDERSDVIERAIDSHIETEALKTRSPKVITDVRILLHWLDSLDPVRVEGQD